MNLPIYKHINIKSASLDDFGTFLNSEMNFKHPVVINLKELDLDQQRETIGLIENFFVSHNLSFKFPYPIYLVTDHEATISQMPIVQKTEFLPKFFFQKDSKINVKEAQVVSKNKLLQQQIANTDALVTQNAINQYGVFHKKISLLENERLFYRSLLNKLIKVRKNG